MTPPKPIDWVKTEGPEFTIVVPQPVGYQPTAQRCLRAEGYQLHTRILRDEYDYGSYMADYWQDGEGFIVVEHDICPWWGAVRELWECEHDWCVFPYPQGMGYPDPAMGCSKYSANLIEQFPKLHHRLRGTTWPMVQEEVLPALWNAGHQWHQHWPPVAHARERND